VERGGTRAARSRKLSTSCPKLVTAACVMKVRATRAQNVRVKFCAPTARPSYPEYSWSQILAVCVRNEFVSRIHLLRVICGSEHRHFVCAPNRHTGFLMIVEQSPQAKSPLGEDRRARAGAGAASNCRKGSPRCHLRRSWFNPCWDELRGDSRFEKIVQSLAPR
jgi:hypothetical protein